MYDKFRLFIDDMDRLGKQLSTCRATFDSAFNKLIHGRGNLVAQAEQLRDLGVQVKKEIPAVITEQTESEILN
jgi:DNA recombination protein RmuC